MNELTRKSASELKTLLNKKEISSKEVYNSFIDQIENVDEKIKAFISVEKKFNFGNGEYRGIPIAIKDNICTEGIRTSCGSKLLDNYLPPYDATSVKRLKQKGFSIIGKTNLDEFAMGSSTENSAYFITRNPWDTSRVPGGSSGGSAAAVASFQSPVSLGSDTGGSVRQPAAYCGVYGLKPTYGRISRYGLIAFASSLDQIGIFSNIPEDLGLLLKIIAGKDDMDSTSSSEPISDYSDQKEIDPRNTKVGFLKVPSNSLTKEMEKKYKNYIDFFENKDFNIEEVNLKYWEYGLYVYYVIASSEASSNLSRYDGIRYGKRESSDDLDELYLLTRDSGFGKEVKRRILLGTFSLSSGFIDEYYLKAVEVRDLITSELKKVMDEYDYFILPTTPEPAFKIGEKTEDPIKMYYMDYFTIPLSLGGFPSLNIPYTFNKKGLPIGFQISAGHFKEKQLINLASFIDNENKEKNRRLET